MNIGLDAHTLGSRVGGNDTYIRNLINALGRIDRENKYLVYLHDKEAAASLLGSFANFEAKSLKPKNAFIRIPFSIPASMLKDKLDLFLLQYAAPPLSPKPYVLVVHDISYEQYPQYFKKLELLRLRALTPLSCRNAGHIITCSDYTKMDLINYYGIDKNKITVTYYGKSEIFKPVQDLSALEAVKEKYNTGDNFILYVGNIQPRKNLPRLIQAFKTLKLERRIACKLVITGNKAWLHEDVFQEVRKEKLESEVILTGYVPEEELPALYSAAGVFVYPSIFEGFGFPVLEAMACGTPVISSNTSSIPEVAGDAALLVDPLSVSQIAAAIEKVLSHDKLKDEMRQKGLKQASLFDWEKTARQTLKIFETFLPHSKER